MSHDARGRDTARDTPASELTPIKVLYVCTANICRSAYAEVASRHLGGSRTGVIFSSAGTRGLASQPMSPEIAEFLPEGATGETFASRRVTRDLVDHADLVLTAEASHRTYLLEEFPHAFRKVLTLSQFAEAAERTELRGRQLIKTVGVQQPPARPDGDVRDPYRRGRDANAAAAAQLDALLRIVVPALVDSHPS